MGSVPAEDPAERRCTGVREAGGRYSATGLSTDDVLLNCWGGGANGKTTFLEALRGVMGDYGQQAPASLLMQKSREGPTNDIARLRGARLVTTVETGQGGRLAEELVKQLTGGDTLAARFLYHDFFEFPPSHTVWLATNYRPVITGTDKAIWRRVQLLPFTVHVPPEQQARGCPRSWPPRLPASWPGSSKGASIGNERGWRRRPKSS